MFKHSLKQPGLFFLLSLVLLGTSCTGAARRESGVYRSEDFGSTWEPANVVSPEFNQTLLARSNITDMHVDPLNQNRVYAATTNQGLFRSEDKGDLWEPITTSGRIQAFSVHPQDSDLLIAARQHQLFYSQDGGELWDLVYTNPNGNILTDVSFDSFNKQVIYTTVETGELLQTVDGAESWTALHTFDEPITQIHLTPKASQRFYIVSPEEGIFKSNDKGKSWENITESIQPPIDQFTNPLYYLDLVVHGASSEELLIHTSQGIYHSPNAGSQWNLIPLLTESDKRQITAIAWDPRNRNILYYATPSVIYHSKNFGSSWTTIPFSGGAPARILLPDPFASGRLYLGIRAQ